MEAPIARKKNSHPRDFIIAKPGRYANICNKYSFNDQASLSSSQNIQQIDPNPQQMSQVALINKKAIAKSNQSNIHVALAKYQQQNQVNGLPDQGHKVDNHYYDNRAKEDQEEIEIQPAVNMINTGSQLRKSVLPQLPTRRNTSELSLPGKIKKQSAYHNRNYPLPEEKSNFLHTPRHSTQKPFNQLALSLMGVKRSRVNRSCFDKRTSSEIKQSYEKSFQKNKQKVEIYQYSVLPFRADDINELRNEINAMATQKQLQRQRNSPIKNPPQPERVKCDKRQSNIIINNIDLSKQKTFGQIRMRGPQRHIKIYHKTSLSNLKGLLNSALNLQKIIIQPPQFFTKPPSQFKKLPDFDHENLQAQACYIFTSLSIPVQNLNIRKYSNCIVIINGNLCIVWHQGPEGKRYFGSWKNKYFDEGVKQGMGLQWAPGRYIFYGQFEDNKRHGFGVMRKNDQTVEIGHWRQGKHVEFGIEKNFDW